MIVLILSHTPVWVWGLLAALMALGFSQTRERRLSSWRLLMLPLVLLGLGLWSMAPGFRVLPLSALVWLAALGAGVALLAGRPAPAGAAWLPAEQRLHLPGSWVPMLVGQAGSALAAELGIQRNSEQIAALDTMGVNSLGYLVSPRLIAALLVYPMQTALFVTIGLWGGSLSGSLLLGLQPGVFTYICILYVYYKMVFSVYPEE